MGLGVVLGHAAAVSVHEAEIVLSFGVPLLGKRTPLGNGRCIVASFIRGNPSIKVGPIVTALAQFVEHCIRNPEAAGSSHTASTTPFVITGSAIRVCCVTRIACCV